ncbi:histidine kinase dimerization/phosphoacceptor domain-containing protein [Streptomyces sp. NPDC086082]|uniref:histidine kinase dimerization/phosphoacceptor domain-containing protein n=1 Tax=Streptomyces sp. NPDC086082 TaxID=3365750 RepID=UPI0037FBEF2A
MRNVHALLRQACLFLTPPRRTEVGPRGKTVEEIVDPSPASADGSPAQDTSRPPSRVWTDWGLINQAESVKCAPGDLWSDERAVVVSLDSRDSSRCRLRAVSARPSRRIARDLHDVVAHHVAVINVQVAVATHPLREQPDAAEEAQARVRQAARTGTRRTLYRAGRVALRGARRRARFHDGVPAGTEGAGPEPRKGASCGGS